MFRSSKLRLIYTVKSDNKINCLKTNVTFLSKKIYGCGLLNLYPFTQENNPRRFKKVSPFKETVAYPFDNLYHHVLYGHIM